LLWETKGTGFTFLKHPAPQTPQKITFQFEKNLSDLYSF